MALATEPVLLLGMQASSYFLMPFVTPWMDHIMAGIVHFVFGSYSVEFLEKISVACQNWFSGIPHVLW